MQPLFEHRLDVAGYDTRVLEYPVLLDGVGHCPQLEATDHLPELLRPFIEQADEIGKMRGR